MKRHRLGDWTCPSGNNVVVYLDGDFLRFEWDSPPPLSPHDALHYQAVILPAVVRLTQEYLEKPGRAVVVQVR